MPISQADSTFVAQLASQFNCLNRDILVADKPGLWRPAIQAMESFLEKVDGWVTKNPEEIIFELSTL